MPVQLLHVVLLVEYRCDLTVAEEEEHEEEDETTTRLASMTFRPTSSPAMTAPSSSIISAFAS
ncbi:hypothetical protein EYF80_031602 [Liparis tanakae]|uniref:Uncharacterized protein n=1 Tax=Liparis tanakae TaxID=230148 RepID=A0A4Z2GXH8_9TELE|nr:hypothetical protein EYF80_031602 [Liparis tanakae]